MATDFDDAIGDMTTELLAEAGGSFVYVRGVTTTTVTLRKSVGQSMIMDLANGVQIEVRPVDFICLTTGLPYDPPERGDKIIGDGLTYEVQPTVSEKVYRRISQQMTRIHTKQVG
jgi:hypothetical protein